MDIRSVFDRRKTATAVGIYDTLLGLWPVLSIDSFAAFTGLYRFHAAVQAIGLAWAVLGIALLICMRSPRAIFPLGIASTLAGGTIALLEVFLVIRGTLPAIFLLHAFAELCVGFAWMMSLSHGESVEELRSYA